MYILLFISYVALGKLLNLFQPRVSQPKIEIITYLDFYEDEIEGSCKMLSTGPGTQ